MDSPPPEVGRLGTVPISDVAPGLIGCGKSHRHCRSPQGIYRVAVGKGALLAPAAHGSRAPDFPDPEGVAFPHVGRQTTGGAATGIDPYRVGPLLGAFSGGVAPGYSIDPLWGSDAQRAAAFFRSLLSPGTCRPQGRRYVRIRVPAFATELNLDKTEVNSPLHYRADLLPQRANPTSKIERSRLTILE